jgi:hypothetical protein
MLRSTDLNFFNLKYLIIEAMILFFLNDIYNSE